MKRPNGDTEFAIGSSSLEANFGHTNLWDTELPSNK